MKTLYESLLDDEEEIINKYQLTSLTKLIDARNEKDFNNILRKLVNQFKIYEENKIYPRGRNFDFSEVNNNDLLICFGVGNTVKIGYKDFRKASIWIFYSDFNNKVMVSVDAPFVRLSISSFNDVYKLPDSFKDDFIKIVKKYHGDRKERIL